jgi:hypothetical protein
VSRSLNTRSAIRRHHTVAAFSASAHQDGSIFQSWIFPFYRYYEERTHVQNYCHDAYFATSFHPRGYLAYPFAFQNKAIVYDLLFRTASETMMNNRG